METPFDVQNGVLHGVDIGKAATSLVSQDGGKGGETRFDKLSGHLSTDRGTRRLTQLNIVSGSLAADGNVTISPRTSSRAGSIPASRPPRSRRWQFRSTSPARSIHRCSIRRAELWQAPRPARPSSDQVSAPQLAREVGQWAESLFGKKEEKKR